MERLIDSESNLDFTPYFRDRISRSLKVLPPFLNSFKDELLKVTQNKRFNHYFNYFLYHLAILYTLVHGEISEYVRRNDADPSFTTEELYEYFFIEDALNYDLNRRLVNKPFIYNREVPSFWFHSWALEKSENVIGAISRIASIIEDEGIDIDENSHWLKAMEAFLSEFTPLFLFLRGPGRETREVFSPLDAIFKKYHINDYYESLLKEENADLRKKEKKFKKQYLKRKEEALSFVANIEEAYSSYELNKDALMELFYSSRFHDDRIYELERNARRSAEKDIPNFYISNKDAFEYIKSVPVTRKDAEALLLMIDPEKKLDLDTLLSKLF